MQRLDPCSLKAVALGALLACLGVAQAQPVLGPGSYDFGPFAARDTSLEGHPRTRALGPVYQRQVAVDDKRFTAIRPLYCRISDRERDRRLQEFVWPMGMRKTLRGETFWRILVAFGHDFDNDEPTSRKRWDFFPFVYAGRDGQDRKYFAVFPIGGRICEFIGQDEIDFALFPLYAQWSVDETTTRNILWPIISWTRGGGHRRFRVFPLYGVSALDDKVKKQFVLWPFWTQAEWNYDNERGAGFCLFPLYGYAQVGDSRSVMVAPPFFRFSRGKGQTEVNCPWPFIRYRSGRVNQFNVWPLGGRRWEWDAATTNGIDTWNLLWVLSRNERRESPEEIQRRFFLLPLVFYESDVRKAGGTGAGKPPLTEAVELADPADAIAPDSAGTTQAVPVVVGRYFKLWPLFSYQRRGDVRRWQALDLWLAKPKAPIERNWVPFWTLYEDVRMDDRRECELLWGTLRYRREGTDLRYFSLFPLMQYGRASSGEGTREWSLLHGLVGYRREGLQRRWRLLYLLRFGGKPAPGTAGGAPEEQP